MIISFIKLFSIRLLKYFRHNWYFAVVHFVCLPFVIIGDKYCQTDSGNKSWSWLFVVNTVLAQCDLRIALYLRAFKLLCQKSTPGAYSVIFVILVCMCIRVLSDTLLIPINKKRLPSVRKRRPWSLVGQLIYVNYFIFMLLFKYD